MQKKAIKYLKYMHAMEIAAGINFKCVFDDLYNRAELPVVLARNLSVAQKQEMHHAQIVRDMLAVLGYDNLAGLMAMPRTVIDGLACLSEPWPDGMDAYAAICFNHALEQRFANGGVQAFADNMLAFSAHIENKWDRSTFRHHAYDFLNTVEADEAWHVEVDAQVIELYQRLHDGFDMPGLLAAKVQVTRSPFIRLIQARQSFLRALHRQPASRQESDTAARL